MNNLIKKIANFFWKYFKQYSEFIFFGGNIDDYENKLWGFSVGLFTSPRENSYRFGWNCEKNNGKIQIHNYFEYEKVPEYKYLCDVEVDKWYKYKIIKNDIVKMEIYDKKLIGNFDNNFLDFDEWNICKTNRPYFGGNSFAPHKMIIINK